MAIPSRMAPEQLSALARLSVVPELRSAFEPAALEHLTKSLERASD